MRAIWSSSDLRFQVPSTIGERKRKGRVKKTRIRSKGRRRKLWLLPGTLVFGSLSGLRKAILVGFIFLALLTTSSSQSATDQPTDLIHLGDLVDVDIVGSTEYDWRGLLTPEGYLDGFDDLPEPIFAKCRSEADIAKAIADAYSRILRDPKVVVRIVDRSNRAITRLDGAVRTPSRFRIQRTARLNELIAVAGGITDSASGEIRIQRPKGLSCPGSAPDPATERPDMRIIKIADILAGSEDANPIITSGDIITVLDAYPIYVIGGVMRPGRIDSRNKVTLSRAIAIAGGLSSNSAETEITIFRRSEGRTARITADLKSIDKGTSSDVELRPFDIVDIPLKGGRDRRLPTDLDRVEQRLGNDLVQMPLRVLD